MVENTIFYDVFVSYSHIDEARAKEIVAVLEEHNLNIWYDRDDIPKGADWRIEIEHGIQSSLSFLFLISPDSVVSPECLKEIEIAVAEKKRFIPILYREISDDTYRDMHPAIGIHNWIFGQKADDWDVALNQIIDTIQTDIDHVRSHTHWNLRVKEWIKNNKDDSYLLTGSELSSAEGWLQASLGRDPEPTTSHIDFIGRGREVSRLRGRKLLGAISMALIVMTILSILSFSLFQQSQKSLERIRILALSNAQQFLIPNQIQRIAFGMEATSMEDVPLQIWQSLANIVYDPGPIQYSRIYEEPVTDIAVSPDGMELAYVDKSGNIVIIDSDTFQVLREFSLEPQHELQEIVYSPDATQIWVAGCSHFNSDFVPKCEQADVMVLTSDSFEHIFTLEGHESKITEIIVSPDSSQITTVSEDSHLIVWDTVSGEQIMNLSENEGNINLIRDVDYFSHGRILATTSASSLPNGIVFLWNLADQSVLPIEFNEYDNKTYTLAITHDDRYIISGTASGSLYVWDMDTLQESEFVPQAHTDVITEILITQDNRVLSTSWDGTTSMWQLVDGSLLHLGELSGHNTRVFSVALALNEQIAYTGGDDGSVIAWDLTRGEIVHQFREHNDWPWKIDLEPDGQRILSPASRGDILLIDWMSGMVDRRYEGHNDVVRQAIFHPNGTQFLSTSEDGIIRLWDISTGDIIRTYGDENVRYFSVSFSSDGSLFIAGGDDNLVHLWSIDSITSIATFEGHTDLVRALHFLPDDTGFISSSYDGTLRLWDIETGEQLRQFDGHTDRVISFSILPSGTQMISASTDRSLIVWDIESGEIIRELQGHGDQVVDVAISQDGKLAASAGWDGRIIIWDIETASIMNLYEGHNGNVSSLLFSQDGSYLISVGADINTEIENSSAEFFVWRIDNTLTSLRNWAQGNRYVRGLTCEEQQLFNIPLDSTCKR